MILVTGGTGLLGAHLLYKLALDHPNIRATYRRLSTIERTKKVFGYFEESDSDLFSKIEWIEADINNIPQLQDAFKGIDKVYHCAALVSFEPDKYKTLRKINIEGTANVVNLCVSHNIKKLCYVSSIAALGDSKQPDQLITEETKWDSNANHNVYAITKYGAELEVWRGSQEGIDVVIINPGIILGAGFWGGGSSGSIFKKVHRGLKYYTNGVTGIVDVWDVVDIMIELMESNIKNERFIIVSENWSFQRFINKIAEELQVAPPKKEAKFWMLAVAWRLDWLAHYLFGKRRALSKQSARSLVEVTKYDNSKINTYLDFNFKPLDLSIKEISVLYLKDQQQAD